MKEKESSGQSIPWTRVPRKLVILYRWRTSYTVSRERGTVPTKSSQVRKGTFNPMVISIVMSPGNENGAQYLGYSGDWYVLEYCQCVCMCVPWVDGRGVSSNWGMIQLWRKKRTKLRRHTGGHLEKIDSLETKSPTEQLRHTHTLPGTV